MKRTKSMKQMLRRGISRAFLLGPLVFLSLLAQVVRRCSKVALSERSKFGRRFQDATAPVTVSAANTVVNAYAVLNASVGAGATAVTVADITTLATGFPAALAQGDIVLIVQMAGATIDTTETVNYGAVTAATLGNAGRYEFAGVEGVANNQITLACPLKNAYTVLGKVQVIRVPQYTTLTIAAAASITAPAWNGQTGGVVALHAETTLQLDGQIDVSAKGFRGGAAHDSRNTTGLAPVFRSADLTTSAEKGEGIAGSQVDYQNTLNGRYGRGAPANGGGGGDSHNAGGGGGANARSGSPWTGQGVMLAVVGAAAWALDPGYIANGNARTTSRAVAAAAIPIPTSHKTPSPSGPTTPLGAGIAGARSEASAVIPSTTIRPRDCSWAAAGARATATTPLPAPVATEVAWCSSSRAQSRVPAVFTPTARPGPMQMATLETPLAVAVVAAPSWCTR